MNIKALLFLGIALVAGGLFFLLDKGLAPYAENQLPFHRYLPFGLTLESVPEWEGGGFVIRDEFGFSLIGQGVGFWDVDLNIEELVGYGVQDTVVAAEVLDPDGNTHYIKVASPLDPMVKQPFRVRMSTEEATKKDAAFRWVELKHAPTSSIKTNGLLRTLSFFVFLISMILAGVFFFFFKPERSPDAGIPRT